jgi:MFS family permease
MRSKPMVLTSLLVAAFLISLETTIVNVALPVLVRELHASTSQLQWVVDAYNLLFAALLLSAGSLSDRFGRKGILLSGLAVFGTASMVGGLVTSPGALIAARAVMGLGAAMTFPATLSVLTNVFRGRDERALAIGLWGGRYRCGDRRRSHRRRLPPRALQVGEHLFRDGAVGRSRHRGHRAQRADLS